MSQTEVQFDCKHEHCDQQVVYRPQAVPGIIYDRPPGMAGRTKTVFLTCPDGHTHSYQVQG